MFRFWPLLRSNLDIQGIRVQANLELRLLLVRSQPPFTFILSIFKHCGICHMSFPFLICVSEQTFHKKNDLKKNVFGAVGSNTTI